jgi:hypothetical protein
LTFGDESILEDPGLVGSVHLVTAGDSGGCPQGEYEQAEGERSGQASHGRIPFYGGCTFLQDRLPKALPIPLLPVTTHRVVKRVRAISTIRAQFH